MEIDLKRLLKILYEHLKEDHGFCLIISKLEKRRIFSTEEANALIKIIFTNKRYDFLINRLWDDRRSFIDRKEYHKTGYFWKYADLENRKKYLEYLSEKLDPNHKNFIERLSDKYVELWRTLVF